MKAFDRILQRWRITKAAPHIPRDARVLDVGCADGALFAQLGERIAGGVGIDPALGTVMTRPGVRYVHGTFPEDLGGDELFDAITMLAVFEHLADGAQADVISACGRLVRPGGVLVMTVPEPRVDQLVHLLARFGLVAGMALHQHHGFEAARTPAIVGSGPFDLVRHERFQLGLNNLFVFRRHS